MKTKGFYSLVALFAITVISLLNLHYVSSVVNVDADTGNLLTAIYKYDYAQDLIPRLSFSTSLELITWLLVRGFSFDVLDLQQLSSILVSFAIVLNAIFWAKKNNDKLLYAILVFIPSLLLSAIQGFASWALLIYPLFIAGPLLIFCWADSRMNASKFNINDMFFVFFLILLMAIDIRYFIFISALFAALVISEVRAENYKLLNVYKIEKLKGVNGYTISILYFFMIGVGVFSYLNFGVHYEATSPRPAIHWNYFNYWDGGVVNYFKYVAENSLKLVQSSFFSENVISDYFRINPVVTLIVITLITLGVIDSFSNASQSFQRLLYMVLLSYVACLFAGSMGFYAFGNIRYQLWIMLPLITIACFGFKKALGFINIRILKTSKVSFEVIAISTILIFSISIVAKNYRNSISENEKNLQVVTQINNGTSALLVDYVIKQRELPMGLKIANRKQCLVDANWIKGKEGGNYSEVGLLDYFNANDQITFLSSWPGDAPHVARILSLISNQGAECRSVSERFKIYSWQCSKVIVDSKIASLAKSEKLFLYKSKNPFKGYLIVQGDVTGISYITSSGQHLNLKHYKRADLTFDHGMENVTAIGFQAAESESIVPQKGDKLKIFYADGSYKIILINESL